MIARVWASSSPRLSALCKQRGLAALGAGFFVAMNWPQTYRAGHARLHAGTRLSELAAI